MSVVTELIRTEADGTISFGNYELAAKTKKENFEFEGDLYKVKTFSDLTRLEKNELFVYESEPGTAVAGLKETADGMEFRVEGTGDSQITVECEPETAYDIYLDGELRDTQKSNLGGKISFSAELMTDRALSVRIVRHV
ncbi:MAG: endosialidase [Lachnospiraceae bacterium]|nr:endosialidase [Lachnospiraceae bacterium]